MDVSVNYIKHDVNAIGIKQPRDKINQRYLWHLRLGHIGEDMINILKKIKLLNSLTFKSYPVCESCLQGKMIKLFFVEHRERITEILALVHSNVCGPFDVPARGGYLYFIIFIDDFLRYEYMYLMRYKSEAFEKFKNFKNKVKK